MRGARTRRQPLGALLVCAQMMPSGKTFFERFRSAWLYGVQRSDAYRGWATPGSIERHASHCGTIAHEHLGLMAWLHAAQSRRVDGPACARDSAAHVSEDVEGMARASCLRTCASAPCCLNSTGACACSASMCAYAGASMRGAHCRINKNTPMRPMLFTVPPLTNARNTHTHPQHTHPRTAPLLPRTHAPTQAHRWVDCGPVAASAWMRFGATPQFPRRPLAHARALAHCDTHTACAHTPPGRPRARQRTHAPLTPLHA